MQVHKDFLEFLQLLNAHAVEFLVVGGYAVAFHGAPRFTGDIDLFVNPLPGQVEGVLCALEEFGFPVAGLNVSSILNEGQILQLGRQPYQIHIMTAISGISWPEAWSSRVPGTYGACPVMFLGKDALILNKRAARRTKDLADVEALEDV